MIHDITLNSGDESKKYTHPLIAKLHFTDLVKVILHQDLDGLESNKNTLYADITQQSNRVDASIMPPLDIPIPKCNLNLDQVYSYDPEDIKEFKSRGNY